MYNILYISYDGITDPLGQSQILPYLLGLANKGYAFTLLSLEKPEQYKTNALVIQDLLKNTPVNWVPLTYSTKKGISTKLKNNRTLRKKAFELIQTNSINLIHARSYPASIIAQKLAKKFKLPYIFDMRGFWADERIDGNIWSLKKPHHKFLYNYFKRKEKELLKTSTHVISLTRAAKDYLCLNFKNYVNKEKITVIPCCADLNHFNLLNKHANREAVRNKLSINPQQPVMIYLGSIGTWYLLSEMIDFFKLYLDSNPNAIFLLVTQNDPLLAEKLFALKMVSPSNYRITSAQRMEVPSFIHAADTAIYFIKPAFSKMASSPVKLAEFMGCGLPVIANSGIGDIDLQATENDQLITINKLDINGYTKAINQLNSLTVNAESNRSFAINNYSLDMGIERYLAVYNSILQKQ